MSRKLKISLVVLTSMAMTLSACSDISVKQSYPDGNRPESTPTAPTGSSTPGKASSTSQLPATQPRQKSNQAHSNTKITTASAKEQRENYKPISLEKIADAKTLIGNDPKAIALSAFGDTESEGGSRDVAVDYPQPNQAIVTITQTGVADDSVGGIRYRAELVPTQSSQTGKQWKMVWAGSQVKCHQGRGHQDWSTELCL